LLDVIEVCKKYFNRTVYVEFIEYRPTANQHKIATSVSKVKRKISTFGFITIPLGVDTV